MLFDESEYFSFDSKRIILSHTLRRSPFLYEIQARLITCEKLCLLLLFEGLLWIYDQLFTLFWIFDSNFFFYPREKLSNFFSMLK